jgi:AcrR family transcriptional regulator
MLLDQDKISSEIEKPREDPRVTRTRRLLVQAFIDLLQEKDFQSITIQDIANRATVNRVTFYAHFQDKVALLEYTIREMIQNHLNARLPAGSPYTPQNLALLVQTVCEFLAEMERTCPPPLGQMGPLMEKQIKAELYEILMGWLARMPFAEEMGSAPRQAQPHPTLEQIAMVTTWAIYGAAMQWIQQKPQIPAAEYVQQILPLILGSFETGSGEIVP